MGLFDVFKKKECAICGGEIGMLGNRKLEDGNMCKKCAEKLSPWFNDRRCSTIAQIKEQLAYREENKGKVAAFQVTRSIGKNMKVLVDEHAGVFVVTEEQDWRKANPDVLPLSDITGCTFDIEENQWEVKKQGEDGQQESYNPPRYRHSYNFYIEIHVNHPYFEEIRFQLNNFSVDVEERGIMQTPGLGQLLSVAFGGGNYNPDADLEYRRYREMGEEIRNTLLNGR